MPRNMEVLKSIPGHVLGAVIGLLVGWFGNELYEYFWPENPSTYAISVNVNGYAKPLPGLLRNAVRENPSMTYRTEPEELAAAWVCEASSMMGDNAHQLLVQYVDLYRDCFSLHQKSRTEFVVRPNRRSLSMRHGAGGWFCKCDNVEFENEM